MADELDIPTSAGSSPNIFKRIGRVFKSPEDILFAVQIGLFIFRLPTAMQKQDLPSLLKKFQHATGPRFVDLDAGVARIVRLRQPWFRLPPLSARNTCYVRALTLFRFLNIRNKDIKMHFGVEPPRTPGGHTRGHAWVTADGKMLEAPDPVVAGRVKEIYVYPQP